MILNQLSRRDLVQQSVAGNKGLATLIFNSVVFEHSATHKLRCSSTVTKPANPYYRYTQTL